MAIQYAFEKYNDYLSVTLDGQWTTEAMISALDAMRSEADKLQINKLLIDTVKISGPSDEMVRFWTGEHIAKVLNAPFRLSVIATRQVYNGFGEAVAFNRGAHIKVFFEETPATAWLLSS
jgi:hypothetical protein